MVKADPHALASPIYGSLAEPAFWVTDGDDGNARLTGSVAALELLLRGLLVKS